MCRRSVVLKNRNRRMGSSRRTRHGGNSGATEDITFKAWRYDRCTLKKDLALMVNGIQQSESLHLVFGRMVGAIAGAEL